MKHLFLTAAILTLASPAATREPASPRGLRVERVVMLMRHGVRPPTKAPAMPAGIAAEAWPAWPVRPGYLTAHGAAAVRLLADHDRATWIDDGLLPRSGCGRVRIVADSDQRTIATAEVWAAQLTPGCASTIEHKPQDVADPLFSPIDERAVPFDAERARRAVLADAGRGGIPAAEARLRPVLTRLDAILCGRTRQPCGVASDASGLAPALPGRRPKLTGAIDRGSTAAQILLLEYAEGKPMAEVGWGRASARDIAQVSSLHAAEFQLLARPGYVARANLARLAPLIGQALTDDAAPSVTMISGHDTNVASLGGLLGLHWQVPGLAADDPSPGGAIVFERLVDRSGRRYVRALYRSQTIDQIRSLAPLSASTRLYVAVMPISGCGSRGPGGLCPLAEFERLLLAGPRP